MINPTNLNIIESTHPERVGLIRVEAEDVTNPGVVLASDSVRYNQPLPSPMVFPLANIVAAPGIVALPRPATIRLYVIEVSPDNVDGPRTGVAESMVLEDVPDGADSFSFD